MSRALYYFSSIQPYNSSAGPVELFPNSIEEALTRIDEVSKADHVGPSAETVEWAKKVLLRVLPRHYLLGAEIKTPFSKKSMSTGRTEIEELRFFYPRQTRSKFTAKMRKLNQFSIT